eukprot:TRINITY_DN10522_c0_g1_i1.p1 TRINITY_DN10522_c0_g1~~TRINITY_DN10522_c0_g1_i1.p1  ORF type:complete len:140 (-),score=9.68 TRINITY_DN10522_c0_g1_i1:380-799(-)
MKNHHDLCTEFPIAWCAPETIRKHRSNDISDIWMLGCTFFEISSFPYEKPFNPVGHYRTHLKNLKAGKRLEFSEKFHERRNHHSWINLVHECTSYEPKHRPRSDELLTIFELFQTDDRKTDDTRKSTKIRRQGVNTTTM